MPNQNSVESQFLDETKQVDNLNAPLLPITETAPENKDKSGEDKEGDEEVIDESVKNRRHRRLERELKAERESSAFMAGRLQAITETEKFRATADMGEHVKLVERIYGTNTPEAVEGSVLFFDVTTHCFMFSERMCPAVVFLQALLTHCESLRFRARVHVPSILHGLADFDLVPLE